MFRPSRLYLPLWQAHQTARRSSRYWTVQERCVHVADMARYSPLAVRINRPGRLPKRNIFPLLGFNSPTLPATTESPPKSAVLGGTKYRKTGYTKATAVARNPPPSNTSTNRRRGTGAAPWPLALTIPRSPVAILSSPMNCSCMTGNHSNPMPAWKPRGQPAPARAATA